MENNNNINATLVNSLLGGSDVTPISAMTADENINDDKNNKDDKDPKTINLCACRYEYNDNFEDVDDKELEAITETYHQMLAARMNLITEKDIEKRSVIADAIIHDVTEILKVIGYDNFDYNGIRDDISKMEIAMIMICDVISIYEYFLHEQEMKKLQKAYDDIDNNFASFIEDDNIVNAIKNGYLEDIDNVDHSNE